MRRVVQQQQRLLRAPAARTTLSHHRSLASVAAANLPRPSARVLDGRELSKAMRKDIKEEVKKFQRDHHRAPHLAVVTIGPRPAEEAQRRALFASGPGEASWFDKVKGAHEAGMRVTHVELAGDAPLEQVQAAVRKLSRQAGVDGVIVEQAFPKHLIPHQLDIWGQIDPEKDVDGMTSANLARLADHAAGLKTSRVFEMRNLPTTPLGVMRFMDACGIDIQPGARCLVIGRSKLVGLPLALLFLSRNATVTIAHSQTPREELKALCGEADIVAAAVGVPRLVKADWLKPGAVALNVGTTFSPSEKAMVGDIDRAGIDKVTELFTPTPYVDPRTGKVGPSGIGPTTLPVLLRSVLDSAKRSVAARAAKMAFKEKHGCTDKTPRLSKTALDAAMQGDSGLKARGWKLATCPETKVPILRKEWVCHDFEEAVRLINDMKDIAEKMNHHPTFHLTKYRHLAVELSSAAVHALTKLDLEQAAAFDALAYEKFEGHHGKQHK